MERIFSARVAPFAFSLSALFLTGCDTGPKPLTSMVIPVCVNGECLVLDQMGTVLIDGHNTYAVALSVALNNTFIYAKDGQWSLANANGSQIIKTDFTDGLRLLTPGFFGFERDGKFGVMDQQGNEVQAPAYDDLYVGGQDEFIVYVVNGKRGILSADGQLLSEPVFDSSTARDDFAKLGSLVNAERNEQKWVVNLKTREVKPVEFDKVVEYANNHLIVAAGNKIGLADATGKPLSDLDYSWMGTPGDGLVAFKQTREGLCGYLDFKGTVVIAPTFDTCEVFGQKGAMVKLKDGADQKSKYGFIDRHGEWLIQPVYDSAGPAVHSFLGSLKNVPGYTQVGVLQSAWVATYGIFDTNKGVESIKPTYTQIGVLTPDLFVFANADSPKKTVSMFGMDSQTTSVGVMNAQGKVLIEPGQFVGITLDKSGRYLHALQDTSRLATTALYDLNGKLLVPAQWQEVVVDEARGALFAYALEGPSSDQTRNLRALYSLDGTPSFETRTVDCDVQQVIDGSGKVLWPTDPEEFCTEPEGEEPADTEQPG